MPPAERQLHLIDGWVTDDPKQFALYTQGDRPGFGYRAQLARDVRSWKPWAWWLAGVAALAYGLLEPDRTTAFAGAALLGTYLYMLHGVVRASRGGRLIEAIARFGDPHPTIAQLRVGTFHHPKGGLRGSTFLEAWAVEKFERPGGWVPVLVSYYPKAETHPVVGIRPLEWQPPASTGTGGARCARHPETSAAGTCLRCGSFVCDYCASPAGGGLICTDCEAKQELRTPRRIYVALVLAALVVPFNVAAIALYRGPAFGTGPTLLGPELVVILALSWSGRNVLRRAGVTREPAASRAVKWVLGIDLAAIFGILMFLRPLLRWMLHLRT